MLTSAPDASAFPFRRAVLKQVRAFLSAHHSCLSPTINTKSTNPRLAVLRFHSALLINLSFQNTTTYLDTATITNVLCRPHTQRHLRREGPLVLHLALALRMRNLHGLTLLSVTLGKEALRRSTKAIMRCVLALRIVRTPCSHVYHPRKHARKWRSRP